jgi:bifunctional DNase/RNase
MVEMTIDSIRVSLMNYQRVVILKEKDSDRYLPIWIGPSEADAIAVKLQDITVPRPLTHDLLRTMIEVLGASLDSMVVCDLRNDTFFAKLIIRSDSQLMEVDCRPSDALALSVRARVPIFAEDSVMDKASILLDKETGKPIVPDTKERGGQMDEEELRRLSAFKEFIQSLDFDDMEKKENA